MSPIVLNDGKHTPLSNDDTLPASAIPISQDAGNTLARHDDGLYVPQSTPKILVAFSIALRPGEMQAFNSTFNVWNGEYGLGNYGSQAVTIDATTGAVIVPVEGMYRMTGMIVGSVNPGGSASAYINSARNEISDPAYPFPFYTGCATTLAAGQCTFGFTGLVGLSPNRKFSIYLSNNLSPNDPYCRLSFELIG
ncbi:hypothetical protein [Caballeronia temeraria]|nr:hypothetical protein [Caballeronia temeraria]